MADARTAITVVEQHGHIPAGPLVSNNTAEWEALVNALQWLSLYPEPFDRATIRGDSRLVIRQMAGKWKVKKDQFKVFHFKATELVRAIGRDRVLLEWVSRRKNREADRLSGRGSKRGRR